MKLSLLTLTTFFLTFVTAAAAGENLYAKLDCRAQVGEYPRSILKDYLVLDSESFNHHDNGFRAIGRTFTAKTTIVESSACSYEYEEEIKAGIDQGGMPRYVWVRRNRDYNALAIELAKSQEWLNCSADSALTIYDDLGAWLEAIRLEYYASRNFAGRNYNITSVECMTSEIE